MKDFLQVCGYVSLCAVAIGLSFGLVVLGNRMPDLIDPGSTRTVRIDCSIAEISPDIPVWAKEECRKLRSGK